MFRQKLARVSLELYLEESEAILSDTFNGIQLAGKRFGVNRMVAKGKQVNIPARTEERAATQVNDATSGGVSLKAIFFC